MAHLNGVTNRVAPPLFGELRCRCEGQYFYSWNLSIASFKNLWSTIFSFGKAKIVIGEYYSQLISKEKGRGGEGRGGEGKGRKLIEAQIKINMPT